MHLRGEATLAIGAGWMLENGVLVSGVDEAADDGATGGFEVKGEVGEAGFLIRIEEYVEGVLGAGHGRISCGQVVDEGRVWWANIRGQKVLRR